MGDDNSPRRKDRWDKAGIIAQMTLPIVLACMSIGYGWYELSQQREASNTFHRLQEQSNATARVNAMAVFVANIKRGTDTTALFGAASGLDALGFGPLAARLLGQMSSSEAVYVLGELARSPDYNVLTRGAASQALRDIRSMRRGGGGVAGGQATPVLGDSTQQAVVAQAGNTLQRVEVAENIEAQSQTAIVTGGFPLLSDALSDAAKNRLHSVPTSVYYRNGKWRTALRFPTRDSAKSALPELRKEIRRSAYMVDWQRWCPDPTRRDEYQECRPAAPEQLVY